MHSLFRSVVSLRSGENVIKESLRSQLLSTVKELQLDYAQDGNVRTSDETASALCDVLEAIFIHGLKETIADRMAYAIADPDQRPEPSFWPPLLVFSHRQIIDQIGKLSLITSDVGRCRAWLRMALNDSLLSSYLHAMSEQNSALSPYYRSSAYLRDSEFLDMTKQLIEGIESCTFDLACNSSLLNVWTNPPLLMAGIWTPPMKSCPITSGTDVAKTLSLGEDNSLRQDDSHSSVISLASHQDSLLGSAQSVLFDEDEALKIILGTNVYDVSTETRLDHEEDETGKNTINDEGFYKNDMSEKRDGKIDMATAVGNSVSDRFGWSSPIEEVTSTSGAVTSESSGRDTTRDNTIPQLQSYRSLVESYNLVSGGYSKTPDLKDFIQRFESNLMNDPPEVATQVDSEQVAQLCGMGFEVVPNSSVPFDIPEFSSLVQQLGKIVTESGLDTQNYTCKTCSQHIGINFGKARVCALTGAYYCSGCFSASASNEDWVIPSRIIHNWDFRRYPVCPNAASFLSQVQHHPLLDIKILNPRLYLAVEDMSQLQDLRVRLNLLRAYLFTCREPVIEELQKLVWPREYLYEHVHLYSVSDLMEIPSGTLLNLLQRAVNFAHNHVISCWLCSQKGFICEICSNPKVIYPFDVEHTYRCATCNSVFHSQCLSAQQPCPRCERYQRRKYQHQLSDDSL